MADIMQTTEGTVKKSKNLYVLVSQRREKEEK